MEILCTIFFLNLATRCQWIAIASSISATITDERRPKDKERSEELRPDEKAELVEHHHLFLFLLVLLRSVSRMSRILILAFRGRQIAAWKQARERASASQHTHHAAGHHSKSHHAHRRLRARLLPRKRSLDTDGTQEPQIVVLGRINFRGKGLHEFRVYFGNILFSHWLCQWTLS